MPRMGRLLVRRTAAVDLKVRHRLRVWMVWQVRSESSDEIDCSSDVVLVLVTAKDDDGCCPTRFLSCSVSAFCLFLAFVYSVVISRTRVLLLYFARRWRAEFCTTSAGLSAKELGLARSCCHGESALLSSPSCHGEFDAHCARDRCDGAAVSPNPSFWERACGPQALLDGIKVAQTE